MSPALNVFDNTTAGGKRTLLLAPPSLATQEEKLRNLFTTFDRPTTDLQMLDRLTAGVIPLPTNIYDAVWILTGTDGSQRDEVLQHLDRAIFSRLVPSMKVGAKLQAQDGQFGPAETKEAILAGLVQKDGVFEKMDDEEEVVVPLRLGAKKKTAPVVAPKPAGTVTLDLNDLDDLDDEIIDENILLTEEDLKRPLPQPPPECQPKVGKRRRACKDCTCGLAERLEAEDATRRATADEELKSFKLESDDLNELDFTVKGTTGSCGNCSLGDAFRCAGCPFIGLPAFEPGQEVQILNDVAQF